VCYERWSHTERRAQWYRRAYRRLALRFIDAVCCNGRLSADYTRQLGFPGARITTGHMAADTEGLERQRASLPPDARETRRRQWDARRLVFLFAGRLIEIKGLRQLLEAWEAFERARPDAATLVIVGEGPEGPALRRLAEQRGLRGVRFVGSVDYEQIAHCYAAADALVMPTLEDNWSLAVPEAMACGLPVLCSKYNGCWPELVHEGENGWVFDPLDQENLLRSLQQCIDRQSELEQMGKRSQEIVSDYTPAKAAQAILATCEIARQHRGHTA
jgi:glycosyltransferase involved in cell wall biosynthesis